MTSSNFSRRAFLEFIGAASAGTAIAQAQTSTGGKASTVLPSALQPSASDELLVTKGLSYDVIAKYGDRINKAGDTFGWDADFTAFMPLSATEAFLFVNHESAHPLFVGGLGAGDKLTKEIAEKMLGVVGCTVLKIRRSDERGAWRLDADDPHNRRFSGLTPIPLVAPRELGGTMTVMGTLANCAGGQTPWRSFLTCEENYQDVWGEIDSKETPWIDARPFYPNARPEHYGWVVEVDPFAGNARKLTALGRFAHEGACVTVAKDGRPVVYMGDDAAGQCIYKFIGDVAGSLATGTLYVADTINGRWLPLDRETNPLLRDAFKDQLDLLVHTRAAAKLVGGTPQDRPEGIDVHPTTRALVISLTNNAAKQNLYGSLLKIEEKAGDHTALEFTASTLLMGGPEAGLACPDNLRFDRRGNLWVTTDMSERVMGTEAFKSFANNGLFYVPMSGAAAGKPIQIASAPKDAELTGPSFASDGRTLFVSVQHPGNSTTDIDQPTSRWPEGGGKLPKPAVVALRGALLDALTSVS
jgi:secreted PhoX family phosphatase